MAISSFNIKPAKRNSFWHNAREAVVTYTIDDKRRNQVDRSAKDAIRYYSSLLQEAVKNYTQRTGQKIQTREEKFLWEAIVNLNAHHTIQDVQKLARELENKYGWQPVQIAVHRDEGYIDAKGRKNYNYHAHIVFFMLDKNGIYRFKKREFGAKKMSYIQDFVAEMLGMERGKSKKITKRERLEHRQYKQLKQAEQAAKLEIAQKAKLTIQELKRQIEEFRKELIERNKEYAQLQEKVYTAEDYRALQALKKELNKSNMAEIYEEFKKLKNDYDKRLEQIEEQNAKIARLREIENEMMQLRPQLETTKKKNEKLEQEIQAEKERSAKYLKTLAKATKIAIEAVGGEVKTPDDLVEKFEEMKRQLNEYKNMRYIERKQSDFDPKEMRTKIKELEGKIEELQAENRRLRAKNANLKAEIEEMMEDRGYGMGY